MGIHGVGEIADWLFHIILKQDLVSIGNVHQHIGSMSGKYCKSWLTLTRNVEEEAVLQQVSSRDVG